MMRRWLLAIVALAGCAHVVSQDEHTGRDGWATGATAIQLVDDTATVTGTVTYPGGDRVDWYYVDLAQPGALDIRLDWTSPRPGLRVLFDAFEDDGLQVVYAKRHARRNHESARLASAHGRIYLRVYAENREDAGRYTLTATLTPDVMAAARLGIEFPLPPALPDLPSEPQWHCEAFEPDRPLDACRPLPPCPTPDVKDPACWAVMPCPTPPDRRVKACTRSPKWDCSKPDPDMPGDVCGGRLAPVLGRVIKLEPTGDDSAITISAGSDQGVTKTWKGTLLRGDTDQPLAGGELVILRVDKRVTVARVHATRDIVSTNSRARLQAP